MNMVTPKIKIATIAIVIPAIFPAFFLDPPADTESASSEKNKKFYYIVSTAVEKLLSNGPSLTACKEDYRTRSTIFHG